MSEKISFRKKNGDLTVKGEMNFLKDFKDEEVLHIIIKKNLNITEIDI